MLAAVNCKLAGTPPVDGVTEDEDDVDVRAGRSFSLSAAMAACFVWVITARISGEIVGAVDPEATIPRSLGLEVIDRGMPTDR